MIEKVILWTNNMVMVFDQKGKQVAKLQGFYDSEEKVKSLEAATFTNTEFFLGHWQEWTNEIEREVFFRKLREVVIIENAKPKDT